MGLEIGFVYDIKAKNNRTTRENRDDWDSAKYGQR